MPMCVVQRSCGISGTDDTHAGVPWWYHAQQNHGQSYPLVHLLVCSGA